MNYSQTFEIFNIYTYNKNNYCCVKSRYLTKSKIINYLKIDYFSSNKSLPLFLENKIVQAEKRNFSFYLITMLCFQTYQIFKKKDYHPAWLAKIRKARVISTFRRNLILPSEWQGSRVKFYSVIFLRYPFLIFHPNSECCRHSPMSGYIPVFYASIFWQQLAVKLSFDDILTLLKMHEYSANS